MRGCVEMRMWVVGGILVFATSSNGAEQALTTLRSHGNPAVRQEAGRLLEVLRHSLAAAA